MIHKIESAYPGSIVVYKRENIPNGINLYNRLKKSGLIKSSGNKFNIINTFTEADLFVKLNELCGQQ